MKKMKKISILVEPIPELAVAARCPRPTHPMKLICDRERLREALTLVNGIIPTKSTRPAVENVCLVATNDALELIGTDTEIALRYRIDQIKVAEPGTILVPGRVCADFTRDLVGETVTIQLRGDKLEIGCGPDRCELPTVDPDEYPVVAHFDQAGAIPIQGGQFNRLVNSTVFAAAKEQGRYAMHGILCLVEDQVLRLVATDGRRLAVASAPIDIPSGPPKRVIVPAKALHAFTRLVSDGLETVHLHFGNNQLGLKTRRGEFFARLIEGEFPRYAAVIPKESNNRMEADPELLSKKLKLVSNVTTPDARAVKLLLTKDKLEIFGRSTAAGTANSQLEVRYDGEDSQIAFNPDFLLEGLRNCERELVTLEFNDRTSPGKFTLGENYLYIVMPITVET
jgi:DNA polymerase-3 subunit beta